VKSNEDNTAIVVTHNIDLALAYGDQLIVIHDKSHQIDASNIFYSDKGEDVVVWSSNSGEKQFIFNKKDIENEDAFSFLEGRMDNEIVFSNINRQLDLAHNNHSQLNGNNYKDKRFKDFFSPVSTQDLSMKKLSGFILITILLLSFLAIGFSVGSLDVLRDKMRDPFVNWISVEVPSDKLEEIAKIRQKLSEDTVKQKFSISSVSVFFREPLNIFNQKKNGMFMSIGRTISVDEPILKDLGTSDNVIRGSMFTTNEDIGLIVTPQFLELCGLSQDEPYASIGVTYNDEYIPMPIPIKAIVKSLPNQSQFLCTDYFYKHKGKGSFSPTHTSELIVFTSESKENVKIIKDSLQHFISSRHEFDDFDPNIDISQLDDRHKSFMDGSYIKVSFLPTPSIDIINNIYDDFYKKYIGTKYKFYHLYQYPSTYNNFDKDSDSPNRLSINVENIEKVSDLRAYLMKLGLEIDLAKIEALNNYNFISKLTNILSYLIIALSIISVCIFIGYILYVFLYKNRTHIGVLKAFGLPKDTLKNIYLTKMFSSIFKMSLIAFVISLFVGYSTGLRRFVSLFFTVDNKYYYFNLFNTSLLLFILLLALGSTISLFLTANYILKRTPGDLLYDRIEIGKK
jgi:hypothetical protein